jgi:hypothetical protein
MAWSLCRLGPGRTRRGHDRTRGLSGPTHLHPNLRPEWVGADAFGQLCLFGLPCVLYERTCSDASWSFASARWRCPNPLNTSKEDKANYEPLSRPHIPCHQTNKTKHDRTWGISSKPQTCCHQQHYHCDGRNMSSRTVLTTYHGPKVHYNL